MNTYCLFQNDAAFLLGITKQPFIVERLPFPSLRNRLRRPTVTDNVRNFVVRGYDAALRAELFTVAATDAR